MNKIGMAKTGRKCSDSDEAKYMSGNQFKEIREYMIELKSYFETYEHAEERIQKLEEGQNTICPSELSEL